MGRRRRGGSETAMSFKMNRKSAVASKLKSSISQHLLHFLSDYSDDVLSDYITLMICNGKNQYQAQEALEDFLGERTGEFVSWLWDLLLKYAHEYGGDIHVLRSKDFTAAGPCRGNENKNSTSFRLKDFLSKDGEVYQSLTSSQPVSYSRMEYSVADRQLPDSPGSRSNLNRKKVFSQSGNCEVHEKLGASEHSIHDSLKEKFYGNRSSVAVGYAKENIRCMDIIKKVVEGNRSTTCLKVVPTKRETSYQDTQPSLSVPSRSVAVLCNHNEEPRCRSVWDRLGKPCDDMPLTMEIVNAPGFGTTGYSKEVLNQHNPMLPVLNHETWSVAEGLLGLGSHCSESRKMEIDAHKAHEHHSMNYITRKRHFGDTSASDNSSCPHRRDSQILSKLITRDSKAASDLISEVYDVKQKLQKIEMEMSELRSKQTDMEKDGKPRPLLYSGAGICSEEDTSSRTVLVSNVHFAATIEALSLYFAKCGLVDKVMILTNKDTGLPKGSAYITFASTNSVEKALALNGTTFFSRTLKVSKKTEALTTTVAPAQVPVKPSQAQSLRFNCNAIPKRTHYTSTHLHWRRESSRSQQQL